MKSQCERSPRDKIVIEPDQVAEFDACASAHIPLHGVSPGATWPFYVRITILDSTRWSAGSARLARLVLQWAVLIFSRPKGKKVMFHGPPPQMDLLSTDGKIDIEQPPQLQKQPASRPSEQPTASYIVDSRSQVFVWYGGSSYKANFFAGHTCLWIMPVKRSL